MNEWIAKYLEGQRATLASLPPEALAGLIETLRKAWAEDRQIFAAGNGGSAANASHFAVDLGKGSSDQLGRRFRILSLTDNVAWMTALGNDYSYDEVFVRQLINYARAGDVFIGISVSGNSPNLVKTMEWCQRGPDDRVGRGQARPDGGVGGPVDRGQRHALRAGRGRPDDDPPLDLLRVHGAARGSRLNPRSGAALRAGRCRD